MARLLAGAAEGPAPVVNEQFRIGDVRHTCADIDRTLATFNWKPEVTLKTRLADLATFVKAKLG